MASLLCGSSRAFVSYCFGRMTFYSWGSPGQFAIFFAADTDFEDQAVACTAGQVEAYSAGQNEAYSAGQNVDDLVVQAVEDLVVQAAVTCVALPG